MAAFLWTDDIQLNCMKWDHFIFAESHSYSFVCILGLIQRKQRLRCSNSPAAVLHQLAFPGKYLPELILVFEEIRKGEGNQACRINKWLKGRWSQGRRKPPESGLASVKKKKNEKEMWAREWREPRWVAWSSWDQQLHLFSFQRLTGQAVRRDHKPKSVRNGTHWQEEWKGTDGQCAVFTIWANGISERRKRLAYVKRRKGLCPCRDWQCGG